MAPDAIFEAVNDQATVWINTVAMQAGSLGIWMGLLCTLSFVAVFTAIGLIFMAGGRAVMEWARPAGVVVGFILLAFGLLQLIFRRSFCRRDSGRAVQPDDGRGAHDVWCRIRGLITRMCAPGIPCRGGLGVSWQWRRIDLAAPLRRIFGRHGLRSDGRGCRGSGCARAGAALYASLAVGSRGGRECVRDSCWVLQ